MAKSRANPRPPGKFGPGRYFDVWFVPAGDLRSRKKISVTTDLSLWKRGLAEQTLDRIVREKYGGGRLARGNKSRVEITDRPDGNVVYKVRFAV